MPDEYISREAALTALQDSDLFNTTERQLRAIRELPAADVAEVVRCKDCRYSKYAAWCEGYACCRTVGEYHHADLDAPPENCKQTELQNERPSV